MPGRKTAKLARRIFGRDIPLAVSFAFVLGLLIAPNSAAQTITAVSATIRDPQGFAWANARVQILLVGTGGQTPSLTPCPVSPCTFQQPNPVNADQNGFFLVNLPANASILPASTQWQLIVTSPSPPQIYPPVAAFQGPQSFTVTVTIAGATQDLTVAMDAAAPSLTNICSSLFAAQNPGLFPSALCVSGGGGNVGACPGLLIINRLTKATGSTQVCGSTVTDDGVDPVFTALGYSSETGGFWDSYTVGTGGVTAGLTVCEGSSSNSVVTCAAGATSGLIGVAQSTVTAGGQVRVCFVGHCSATEDSTIATQDWSIMSPTVAGELTDSGINVSQPCPAGEQALYTQSGNTGAGAIVGVDFLTANDTCRNNGSGTINPASQFATAYYSAPGTGIQISGIGPNTNALTEVWSQANGTAPFWGPLGVPVDNISGASYSLACTDSGRHKIFSSASAVSLSFPTANTCTGPNQPNFITLISATGAGTVTITPATGTIGKIGSPQGASLPIPSGSSAFIYTDSVSTGCTVTACYDAIVDASTGGSGIVTQDTVSVPELLINNTNHVVGSSFTWSKATEQANQVWVSPQIANLPNVVQVSTPNICFGGSGQTTCATTFPSNVSSPDAILLIQSTGNTSTMTAGGVTDSLSNAYATGVGFSQTAPNIFYVCKSAAGSDTVTFTATTGGAPEINVVAVEISGAAPSACTDQSGTSTSSLSVSTGSAVAQGTEFVLAFFHDADTTLTPVAFTPAAGYTQIVQFICGAGCFGSSAHETMAVIGGNSNTGLSGVQTATVTATGTTTNLSAAIITLKLVQPGGIPTFQGLQWATLPVNTTTPVSGDCLEVVGNPQQGKPYQITDNGTACGNTVAQTVTASGLISYSGSAVPFSSTTFLPLGGGGTFSTTEANVQTAAPQTSAISSLFVQLSAAPGTGNSLAFTFRDAGSSQAVTCTISGSGTSCSDTTHSFNVTKADLLDMQVVPTGTVAATPNVIYTAQWGTKPFSQNVVTGSRSIGTAFQNTGSTPLYVNVSAFSNTTGNFVGLTDSSATPTTQVANTGLNANFTGTLSFVVLPGNFYKVTLGGTTTLSSWVEWQ